MEMTQSGRMAVAFSLLLLLPSCLLSPGKFTSTLDIRRDRSFTFTYVGEVIAQQPKTTTEEGGDAKAKPKESTAATDARMRQLADTLSKEYGYRSVKYLGNSRFAVDYAVSGRLTHSFLYPFNIDAQAIIPFVAIELRGLDRVRMKAPAFGKDSTNSAEMGPMGGLPGADKANDALDGTFTLTTDAEIISQNQEEGARTLLNGRKQIVWRATPQSGDAPSASLKLDPLP